MNPIFFRFIIHINFKKTPILGVHRNFKKRLEIYGKKGSGLMNLSKFFILTILSLLFLSACGGGGNTQGKEEGDYEGTKKMVADILKTDEGKKAITEVLSSDDMQKTYVIDAKVVQQTVQEALTSDKGKEFWTKMFQDPKFVESFSLALQDQQEKVMKTLMSDPEFQKKFIEILSNPEMEDQTLTVLTGQKFRSHLEKVMEEMFSSPPMFQAKISELLLNAAKEMKPSEGGQSQSGGQGESGGGQQQQGGQGEQGNQGGGGGGA